MLIGKFVVGFLWCWFNSVIIWVMVFSSVFLLIMLRVLVIWIERMFVFGVVCCMIFVMKVLCFVIVLILLFSCLYRLGYCFGLVLFVSLIGMLLRLIFCVMMLFGS